MERPFYDIAVDRARQVFERHTLTMGSGKNATLIEFVVWLKVEMDIYLSAWSGNFEMLEAKILSDPEIARFVFSGAAEWRIATFTSNKEYLAYVDTLSSLIGLTSNEEDAENSILARMPTVRDFKNRFLECRWFMFLYFLEKIPTLKLEQIIIAGGQRAEQSTG